MVPTANFPSGNRSSIAQELIRLSESPGSVDIPKHVILVMDGLKEFSMEPLEWVLKNIALEACCTITLLGVMPWLNIPLSSKAWRDIWTMEVEDLSSIKEKIEWKSDLKYQKVQRLVDLCQNYGVVPQIRTQMGYPLRLLVVEQVTSFHATLVVFDRHHEKKNIEYYAEKVPCIIVKMNEDGDVDLIKGRSHIDNGENTSAESTTSLAPPPKLIISERLKKILKLNWRTT